MPKLTDEKRNGLALDAQVSIVDSAEVVRESVRGFASASMREVRSGGVRNLARKLAAAAIVHGAPVADANPSNTQRKFAAELAALTERQRARIFLDALIGHQANGKGKKLAKISPITSWPYPSDEQPGESESSPYISVKRNSRFGRIGGAALIVSLWRPSDKESEPVVVVASAASVYAGSQRHYVVAETEPTTANTPFDDWP